MKRLLIDTDIGIDSDDALAIAAALALEKQGVCSVAGISTCTTRSNASAAVKAIAEYYGFFKETATYDGKTLACDKINIYADSLAKLFSTANAEEESVNFLRRKLQTAKEKITLVSLGPLTVIAELLLSSPDAVSPLSGVDLVREKTDALYAMAGNFVSRESRYAGRCNDSAEWNVLQNIPAAQHAIDLCPVPIIFCPFEAGAPVLSGQPFDISSPVGLAIKLLCDNWNTAANCRSSWDPITVCEAAGMQLFDISPRGTVTVDDEGNTRFTANEGTHRYLIERTNPDRTADKLNELYKILLNQ